MVVVPHRPTRRLLVNCSLILLFATTTFIAYRFGLQSGADQERVDQLDRSQLAAEVLILEEENSSLRSEIALLDRSSVMDQQANNEVQETILTLRERVAELEQDVLSYRQAMSEEFEDVGLVVDQMDIESTELAGRFNYKLVMRQEQTNNETYLIGHARVSILGSIGGEQLELPLHEISDAEDLLEIKLRFRYFQNIEGQLQFPEGFMPEVIEIYAVETAPMAKTVNKSLPWVVEGG